LTVVADVSTLNPFGLATAIAVDYLEGVPSGISDNSEVNRHTLDTPPADQVGRSICESRLA
jgi:hypothetical protein